MQSVNDHTFIGIAFNVTKYDLIHCIITYIPSDIAQAYSKRHMFIQMMQHDVNTGVAKYAFPFKDGRPLAVHL